MRTQRKQGFNPEQNRRNNNRDSQSNSRWQQYRYPENQQHDRHYGSEGYNRPHFREDERYDTYRGSSNNQYNPDTSGEYDRRYSSWNDRNDEDRGGYSGNPRRSDYDSRWSDADYRNQGYRNRDDRDFRDIDNDYPQDRDYRDYDDMHDTYGRGHYNQTESDRRRMNESSYRAEDENYMNKGYTTRSGRSGYGGRSNIRNHTW